MNLILLPGNGLSNKSWILDVAKCMEDLFDKTYVQSYEHWKTGSTSENIDMTQEEEKLTDLLKDMQEYSIFAKSAGAILTMKAIFDKKIHPSYCIFTGFAYNFAKRNNFDIDLWLKDFNIPTLLIQKSFDPEFSFLELKDFWQQQNAQNYSLIEIEGSNHEYEDMVQLHNMVKIYQSQQ